MTVMGEVGLAFVCIALLCIVMFLYALLRIATHCYALLRIATNCYALLRIAMHCYALLYIAIHCYTLLCIHVTCMYVWHRNVEQNGQTHTWCHYNTYIVCLSFTHGMTPWYDTCYDYFISYVHIPKGLFHMCF